MWYKFEYIPTEIRPINVVAVNVSAVSIHLKAVVAVIIEIPMASVATEEVVTISSYTV